MMRRCLHSLIAIVVGSLMIVAAVRASALPAPVNVDIPAADDVILKGRLYVPEGPGPFPVAVVSHGSPANAEQRAKTNPVYAVATGQLLRWGFMVLLPVRRGYGETGGAWAETYESCTEAQYTKAGLASAEDLAAAVRFAKTLPKADPGKVVLIGQSAGGWGSLAAGTRSDIDVRAIVNFAGGRGGMRGGQANNNCAPERLVEAAGEFGAKALRPSLWIYTENDKFFAPELSRQMFERYNTASGKARMVLLPAFGKDGHSLIGAADGLPLWLPHVETFLKEQQVLR